MTDRHSKTDIDRELARTGRAQAEAADPAASVWVSANAGTGKTHVLTNRVLRLLLSGTEPQRILCLTYTKAAAAEMSKRVFDRLAAWTIEPDVALAKSLTQLTGRAPQPEMLLHARTLFAAAIETPGGLKVQTIHAFCERLLQRFPLEAGVSPGFAILDDVLGKSLLRDAIDEVLTVAASGQDRGLADALGTAVAYAEGDRFDELLEEALGHRRWLEEAVRLPSDRAGGPEGLDFFEAALGHGLGVRKRATCETIAAEISRLLRDTDLDRAAHVLATGGKTDAKMAAGLQAARAASPGLARARALSKVFLKSDAEPKSSLMTKALRSEHSYIDVLLTRAQGQFVPLWTEFLGAEAVAATMALTRLAEAVLQRYDRAKARRAALDFDDLIEHAGSLLSRDGSAEWVLFKLDNGLDHILVDESQDTSLEQWQVVEALAREFFAGRGARDVVRTLFAVGDEKQSIYSFQGAAPEMFARMGHDFAALARDAGATWRTIPLDVSFRTVAPVLDAVDTVFSDPSRTPGVPGGRTGIRHIAKRMGHEGLLELWPTETFEASAPADAWSPGESASTRSPAARLADRIAVTIKGWLDNNERLSSEDRPILAGDILILVRKRAPFANAMVAALKTHRVPVAGSDRLRLTDQIAVEDLVSLARFLTLPEDDLSLAEALKSPLFGLTDDDLIALAPERKRTLWRALLDSAAGNERHREAAERLRRWRKEADYRPPFEFFASILDSDGMRSRLVSRLGPEASDPIDELLSLALSYDEKEPPSLTGFLGWLSATDHEIKRDLEHGKNEVRVMTVHGAKGLEAPIVFLPDTCSAGSAARQGSGLIEIEGLALPKVSSNPFAVPPSPFAWAVKGTARLAPLKAARARLNEAESHERDRLLYVAMTRARDRLYVCGFEGSKGRAPGCWYDLISEALDPVLTPAAADGSRRIASTQEAEPEPPRAEKSRTEAPSGLPDWASRPAPREPQLAIPLAPSRLAPYDTDEEGEPLSTPPPADRADEPPAPILAVATADNRFLRGTLTHALLEHLPGLPRQSRKAAAEAFIAKRAGALTARARRSIVSETLAVLEHPQFAPIFDPNSRAEIPLVAELQRPRGSGPPLRITGQVDRLAILPDCALIVDYKTNRPPPAVPEKVAEVYLLQLAAYRLAVAAALGDRPVRAAILWTDGPRLMEIPGELLTAYEARLWDLDRTTLTP